MAGLGLPVSAQDADLPPLSQEPPPRTQEVKTSTLEVLGYGEYRINTNIQGGGDFEMSRLYGDLLFKGDPDRGSHLSFGGRARFDDYDFSGFDSTTRLSPTPPWDDIYTYGAGFELRSGGDLQIWGGGIFDVAAEDGVDFDEDSWIYGGFAGVSWAPEPDIRIGGGVGFLEDLDDTRWYPVVDLRWWLADEIRVETHSTIFAHSDLSFEIVWEFARNWETGAGIAYQFNRFRLDTADEAVGQDRSLPIWWKLGYRPTENIDLFFRLGFFWQGELRVENSTGESSEEYGSDILLGLGLALRF
jgi:hypothetical protein